MANLERVTTDLSDIRLRDAAGGEVRLDAWNGVNVLVLMRHRH
jgi:hypothetical protein